MKHFALERWVDFSREAVDPEVHLLMQVHAQECSDCRKLADFTEQLTECCNGMVSNPVPDAAVRMARAIFHARSSDRPRRGSRIPVELIFDSFLAPAPVGLRATWQIGWQALYRAEECSLDLRIEPELKSSKASVIGQVTNHVSPAASMENLAVRLQSGLEVLAETVSNRFGEFQLDYEQQAHVNLIVQLHDARMIQVPLKKLVFERPAAKSRRSHGR